MIFAFFDWGWGIWDGRGGRGWEGTGEDGRGGGGGEEDGWDLPAVFEEVALGA